MNLPARAFSMSSTTQGEPSLSSLFALAAGALRRARDRAEGVKPLGLRAWSEAHRLRNGRPFTPERHKPLVAIYDDPHPEKVLLKPAQCGCSEYAVNLTLHT